MAPQPEPPPQYTRYRTGPRLLPRREGDTILPRRLRRARPGAAPGAGWRARVTRKRVVLALLALLLAWVGLSLLLFLISSRFERTSPPGDVAAVLDPAGFPLTSANNILVLGSDRREKHSKEPGANKSGPSRSDTIMLIRTGGGHAARLSIPRDTVVEIPGHGEQKINAAYAFGGPALSVRVLKRELDIPINHLVEVNFEDFPKLIDAMGGVDYTGDCVISRVNGGFRNGGYTLRLRKGTHHIDGKAALALARTRENLCRPGQSDLQRAEHQQALFTAMKNRLLSFAAFIRLPWIAWNAPPTIISDMSGESLLGLFGSLAIAGTPATRVLHPSSLRTLADGETGLTVSRSEWRAAAARFERG